MINVKSNFKIGQSDLSCRKGCAIPEDQQHILHCKAISDDCLSSLNAPRYSDLFGDEVDMISTVGRILMTRSKQFLQDIKPSARATQTTGKTGHPLAEVTNILYLLALVILTSFLICSHWLTQSQKEADIYYLFIIG